MYRTKYDSNKKRKNCAKNKFKNCFFKSKL